MDDRLRKILDENEDVFCAKLPKGLSLECCADHGIVNDPHQKIPHRGLYHLCPREREGTKE